eukprot:13094532-Alexandrium_andersonii.AAC.1
MAPQQSVVFTWRACSSLAGRPSASAFVQARACLRGPRRRLCPPALAPRCSRRGVLPRVLWPPCAPC